MICPGVPFRHRVNDGADTFDRRQIAGRRNARLRIRISSRIDGKDVIILRATFILHEQHITTVLRPEVPTQRPLGIGSKRPGIIKRLINPLHPNIHHSPIGLAKRNPLPIGRELRTGDFGIAEKDVAVNQRRQVGERIAGAVLSHGCPRTRECTEAQQRPQDSALVSSWPCQIQHFVPTSSSVVKPIVAQRGPV